MLLSAQEPPKPAQEKPKSATTLERSKLQVPQVGVVPSLAASLDMSESRTSLGRTLWNCWCTHQSKTNSVHCKSMAPLHVCSLSHR